MVARPNNATDKVRELQRWLHASVKRDKGAAGIDMETLMIERRGVEEFLAGIQDTLRAGGCRPLPVRRRYIAEAGRAAAATGIPTVRDRLVHFRFILIGLPNRDQILRDPLHRPRGSGFGFGRNQQSKTMVIGWDSV